MPKLPPPPKHCPGRNGRRERDPRVQVEVVPELHGVDEGAALPREDVAVRDQRDVVRTADRAVREALATTVGLGALEVLAL